MGGIEWTGKGRGEETWISDFSVAKALLKLGKVGLCPGNAVHA